MRRIVLDLQCTMFADAISQTLERSDPDFSVLRARSPEATVPLCGACRADAVILEVTGYAPWRLADRLELCAGIRAQCPGCKVLLLVDENADRALARQVLQAKKDGRIDNFIYASVSPAYLAAVLDAL